MEHMSFNKLEYRKLLSFNAAGRELRDKKRLLIYGTCVRDEHKEIFQKFASERIPLAVCLEEDHFNMVALKLASIVARVDLDEIVVLTVDGSPHCVQLHHLVEEVERVTGKRVNVKHYVIEKKKAIEINRDIVKTARYLSKVKKLYERKSNNV